MNDNTTFKGRIVVVTIIWFFMLGLVLGGYYVFWRPYAAQKEAERKEAEHQEIIAKTSAPSRYKYTVNFVLESFSGYALFRQPRFREECAKFGGKIELVDEPNYQKRLNDLADGKLDMGVFTVDALIKTSFRKNDTPVTIVAVVDESKGADAVVAAGKKFPNIDSLNNEETKFVCVPDSPSETFARVLMAHFSLDRVSQDCFVFMDDAEKVYKAYQQAKPDDNRVFVLWEPFISRVLDNPDYHSLIDSSKFRGYIMDVIVARRDFLVKNPDQVESIIKAYLTTVYESRNDMMTIVAEDAKQMGMPLKKEQAEKLTDTIWFKNTQENFGHFGLTTGQRIQHIEDVIRNITNVLLKTGAIKKDPTDGSPNLLYDPDIVRTLYDNSWHPGFSQENVRQESVLRELTEAEWEQLKPVGTLHVPRLVFARGTVRLTEASEITLDELAKNLTTWPQYYLTVQGSASGMANVEANHALAKERANVAVEWLVAHGVERSRIRATSKLTGSTTVSFILGEMPY